MSLCPDYNQARTRIWCAQSEGKLIEKHSILTAGEFHRMILYVLLAINVTHYLKSSLKICNLFTLNAYGSVAYHYFPSSSAVCPPLVCTV